MRLHYLTALFSAGLVVARPRKFSTRTFLQTVLVVLATPMISKAYGVGVSHTLTLDVTGVVEPFTCDPVLPAVFFSCGHPLPDTIVGRFDVDSSLLALQGDNLLGTVTNFYMQIGNFIFDQNNWGLNTMFACSGSLGSPLFCFDVHGGVITGVRGGAMDAGDFISIDFQDTTFFATQSLGGLTGTFTVSRVAEPSSVWLLVSGLAIVAILAREGVR